MELFKNADFDFLGKKWWFILPSLVLIVAGLGRIAAQHGLLYSIDFKGGTQTEIRWEGTPPPF
jgi:preprotein translocase subunit SecF